MSSRIEELRRKLVGDPEAVRMEALDTVRAPGTKTSDRVRMCGLAVAASSHLGDPAAGLKSLAEGKGLAAGRASRLARIELWTQGALLFAQMKETDSAREHLKMAEGLLREQLARPKLPPNARKTYLQAKAQLLVTSGDITLRLRDRHLGSALEEAFAALEIASHDSFLDERIRAISLLTHVLISRGSLSDISRAMHLIRETDALLSRRRCPQTHPYRIRVRWATAVALGRLGSTERAGAVIQEVIERFIEANQWGDAQLAVETMCWVVGDRAAKPDRAQYLREKYEKVLRLVSA